MRRGRGARDRYQELLGQEEGYLYCNLAAPHIYDPFAEMPLFAIGGRAVRSAAEIRWEREGRIANHRRVANDLRRLASATEDLEKRRQFESAAALNDGLAETLESLLSESLEIEASASEKTAACEKELRSLRREREELERQPSVFARSAKRREVSERIAAIAERIEVLESQLVQLLAAEEEASRRSQPAMDALNDARRMLAEEDGRAKFRQLESDIRARLCTQWNACEQVKKYDDEVSLTMAVGDVLMTLTASVPVATLAVLVVKIGIKKFCNCH